MYSKFMRKRKYIIECMPIYLIQSYQRSFLDNFNFVEHKDE